MATKAFILIETSVGKSRDVIAALRGIDNITSVDVVTGPYDIIAVLKSPDLHSVGSLVTSHIHTVAGIQRTVTCLAVDS